MPSPTLHFIENDTAAPELIVRWCKARWQETLPPGLVFCVPSSLAMRRLRDALTMAYHTFHGVRFTLPAGLTAYFAPPPPDTIATDTELLCAWDRVFDWLQQNDSDNLVATFLFPGERKWLNRPAARYAVAQRILRLRATLAEATLDFAAMAQHPKTLALDERERGRWAALDALETQFREVLMSLNLVDPADLQLQTLRCPMAQPIESQTDWHLVVACVPDLMPALSALFTAAPHCDILIQSHLSDPTAFTDYGTPDPKVWNDLQLSLPDEALELAETPSDEAYCAERFLGASGTIDPAKVCLCVLNHEIMPTLTDRFEAHAVHIFEPDPIELRSQPAVRALRSLFDLLQRNSLDAIPSLLTLPEIATFFKTNYADLRRAYFDLLEAHSPTTLSEAQRFVQDSSALADLFRQLSEWMAHLQRAPVDGARTFLIDLFGEHFADPVENALLFSTFEALQNVFNEIETVRIPDAKPNLALLDARLNSVSLHPIRGANDCSYEGRFEVLWSPAERFVLAGLNETIFPDTTFEDPFLPNRFRAELGLRSDKTRLARDAYILETLCRRCAPTNIKLLCSKLNNRGDWLKPSRLFFRCTAEQQVTRAKQFFLKSAVTPKPFGADSALRLSTAPHLWKAHLRLPKRLSASAISTYLNSPLDFLFQRILYLDDTDDTLEGVPPNLFGTLIHSALEILPSTDATDSETLAKALIAAFNKAFCQQYGASPNIELEAVRMAAEKRLRRAAMREAQLRREGWKTYYIEDDTSGKDWEVSLQLPEATVILHGKVDRIDYHAEKKTWRIIDYKTGAKGNAPDKAHYKMSRGSDQPTWTNFQLPIYRLLARHALKLSPEASLELCYFTLPDEGQAEILPFKDPVSEADTLKDLEAVLIQMQAFATPETLYSHPEAIQNPLLRHLITMINP